MHSYADVLAAVSSQLSSPAVGNPRRASLPTASAAAVSSAAASGGGEVLYESAERLYRDADVHSIKYAIVMEYCEHGSLDAASYKDEVDMYRTLTTFGFACAHI